MHWGDELLFGFFWTENSGLKLKELLSGLSSLTLTDAEAVGVMSLLQERSPSALEAWYKVRHYFECVGYLTDATSRRLCVFKLASSVLCFQCGCFLHQSTARPDPVALERERLLSTVQEEASIAKDKVKQLSQVRSFTLAAIPLQFFAK